MSSAWPFLVRLSFVLRGRQCCASVVAKAHLVGGGVRARVFRRDLREYPGAHYEMCARPRSGAIFGHIHACDIRCLRSAVLQPPGRTPAVVARGTRAFCLVRAMPFAPWFVLRVAARRRSLSYALALGAGFSVTRPAFSVRSLKRCTASVSLHDHSPRARAIAKTSRVGI